MLAKEQMRLLMRGVLETVPAGELEKKLEAGRPLRVKFGVDPTTPDVHLGHTVVFRKLRQFQELGHQAVLIVGDYTATVGDPSGRSKERPILAHEDVLRNAKTYQEQFFQVVDRDRAEVVFNGDWFGKLGFTEITRLMSQITVAQMLEREDFQNRYRNGQPISLHEFLYPMMQGYDSVMVKSDVELGGMDQKFNVLRGREMQKGAGQEPQVGMFLPILLGIDGKEKMSKSLGNYVGIGESAPSMYHKLYSMPDDLIESYFTLLTEVPLEEVRRKTADLKEGRLHPNSLKEELAVNIVTQYHGAEAAAAAVMQEKKVHAGDALPEDAPLLEVAKGAHWVCDLLVQGKLAASNGEGRRLIQNGGVRFDGRVVTDAKENLDIAAEHVLKVGKRNFLRVKAG